MSRGRLLCIDFDGVLHLYDGTWGGEATITGPAVPGAIAALQHYLRVGFSIAIFSTRSRTEEGRRAMCHWLNENGVPHPWISYGDVYEPPEGYSLRSKQTQIRFPLTKPPAWLYIDDRAWRFDGTFPTVEALSGFQTWWERERG